MGGPLPRHDRRPDVIADEIAVLLHRFRDGGSAEPILPTEHKTTFRRLAIEAKSLIDEALGHANDFSPNLVSAINSGSGGLSLGPSYPEVSEAVEIVRADNQSGPLANSRPRSPVDRGPS